MKYEKIYHYNRNRKDRNTSSVNVISYSVIC